MSILQDHIFGTRTIKACTHPACVATRKLEQHGANLRFGQGRHCELAVLAAAGDAGMLDADLVAGRRAYAKHLGVTLDGLTTAVVADAEYAIHARWAAKGNTVGNPNAKHAIPLGTAKVTRTRSPIGERHDRYRMYW